MYPTEEVVAAVRAVTKRFTRLSHVIVVGIGGSSLGLEAIHGALGEKGVRLSVLDMLAPEEMVVLIEELKTIKKASALAVCIISKSGSTTETLANASVLLRVLEDRFGAAIYGQTLMIGDPGAAVVKTAKKLGVQYVPMPAVIGGRFSVVTEVGLVPLSLLGHDIDAFAAGVREAALGENEAAVAARSQQFFEYIKAGVRHFNFFAFDRRLVPLGAWYRQLLAESLGKSTDRSGKPVKFGFLPTISTPVELHSVCQLYLSGFPGVFTEFVSLDKSGIDYKVGPTKLAPQLKKFTLGEISAALYGGVVAAYRERKLPYRATVFSEADLPNTLGRYIGAAMLETMYLAHLMNVSAFDQPNVELYKQKTRELLGL